MMKKVVLLCLVSLMTLGIRSQSNELPLNKYKCVVVLNDIVCNNALDVLNVLKNHPADIENFKVIKDGSLSERYSVEKDFAVITVNTKTGVDISKWRDMALVKGKVTDQAGEPLIGVVVQEVGERNVACITDTGGNYTMILKNPYKMIWFISIGFLPTLVTKEHAEHVIMTERPEMEDSGIVTIEVNTKEYNLE